MTEIVVIVVTSATKRVKRRETTILISVTRLVYVQGQMVSFDYLLRSHRLGIGRTSVVGTPFVSGKVPLTRLYEHPTSTAPSYPNKVKAK